MMRGNRQLSWKSNPLPRLALAGMLALQGLSPCGAEPRAAAIAAEGPDPCLSDALCRAHYQRARAHSRDGEHEAALTAYRTAYRRGPAAWLLLGIGRTLHKLGRPKEALAHYQQYQEQIPSPPPELEARLTEYLKEVNEELAAAAESPPPPIAAPAVASAALADGSTSAPPAEGKGTASASATATAASAPGALDASAAESTLARRLSPRGLAVTSAPAPSGAPPPAGELRISRRLELGVTLGLAGALGIAALGTGTAAIQSANYATGVVFVGAQPPAEAQAASDRSRTLALATDILIGAGATTLVAGLLATYLRKPARTPGYAVGLSGRGASFAMSWSSP